MSESKDPAIKLFGRTIPLPEAQSDNVCNEITKTKSEDVHLEDTGNPSQSAIIKDGKPKEQQLSMDGTETQVNPKPNEDSTETTSIDEDKVLKRPDKVVPCPRCNSFETKFCYFNNYNVNQPRHFCKNCQRYWTAGGTMRNVPVGAGRRKNKHLASQFRQMLGPTNGIPITTIQIPDTSNQQQLSDGESPTGIEKVLHFGPEGPLCESMSNVLHLRDQKRCFESAFVSERREEPSSSNSSVAVSSFQEKEVPKKAIQSSNELTQSHTLQSYPVPPWVFSWNPCWNNGASPVAARCSSELVSIPEGSNSSPIQWCSTPMLAVPGFCTPNGPLQLVPTWGCMPIWAAGTTNAPLVGPNIGLSPSSFTSSGCSGKSPPILGKHCRDANTIDDEKLEQTVLTPKTLRIDDKDEGLKSSVWASLGFKTNEKEIETGFGIFKPFKSGVEAKDLPSESTQVLEANPAAHSRSQTFQEST